MKKLLFVISELYKGGAETSFVNLLNKIDSNKYMVDLIILNQRPIKDGESLIGHIPNWVKIYDAYKKNRNLFIKVKGKFLFNKHLRNEYNSAALNYVRNRKYDWAFFIGEWSNPEFVATQVNADKKAAWIHTDISKADYFNEEQYFRYYSHFDKYIFVSNNSLKSSCERFKFLKEKAITIYNISDCEKIKKLSSEKVNDFKIEEKFTLVTCANLRPEKNHLRQLEVMKVLKDRGVDIRWINIGSTANNSVTSELKSKIKEYGYEDDFLLLGAKSNPYKYMALADAVAVLSDYESWSMVITEAKVLGIPVISTKTSGALEQIQNEITGILTDFSVYDIAKKLERYILNKELQKKIKLSISTFDNTLEILNSFDKLLEIETGYRDKNIIYIIDDINYLGGAHIATKYQIKNLLDKKQSISIFSSTCPNVNVRNELLGVEFLTWTNLREDNIFNMRLLYCLTNKFVSFKEKLFKLKLSFNSKILKNDEIFDKEVLNKFEKIFSEYNTICVMSEGSAFKEVVSKSKHPKKIQWIHTDYCYWRNKNEYARKMTKNDGEIWKEFDYIVILADSFKESFCNLYPHLNDKVRIIKNIMPIETIRKKSRLLECDENLLKFITVSRIDKSKGHEKLIPILFKLKEEGFSFVWTIIGSGSEQDKIKRMINDNNLENMVYMEGSRDNPFPYIKDADVFAIFSEYEGIPNTIYESLILGVPVLSTNVGGINTQIEDGKTGWLIDNNEESIYNSIKYILENQEIVKEIKSNLSNYSYDNEDIIKKTYELFEV